MSRRADLRRVDAGYGTFVVLAVALVLMPGPAVGLVWLLLLVAGPSRARRVLPRRPVRRALDVLTGCALLAFGTRLATGRG